MKKILTLLLALCSTSAFATTNNMVDLLPIGSPLIKVVQAKLTGSVTRPDNFTYAMPSGDSTGLFVIFQEENTGSVGDYPTLLTYGGVTMIPSANSTIMTNDATPKHFNIYIFFLNDSATATRTDDTFRVTYYDGSGGKNNASYAFTIFSADEVKQAVPLEFCSAQQTGGNLHSNDSLSCGSTVSYNAGDLYMSVGGSSAVGAGPFSSNYPDTITNRASNSMWIASFYKQMTSATTITPYMKTNGANGMRFIMLATRIKSSVPPPVVVLGVELSSFTGRNQKDANILYWSTKAETNLKNYEVQYSADGKGFSTIGYVTSNSKSNTSNSQEYSFSDQARANKSFYRLKVVDMDGSFTYSEIVVLGGSVLTAPAISVYPNPSTGTFSVTVNTSDFKLKVINAFGQQVGYTIVNEATQPRILTIRLDNATTGFYYVVAESESAASTSKVFVQ